MVHIHNFAAVILAGGKSSRMGQDKSLLPFGTYSTLIEYQHTRLQGLFKKVYISSKEDKFPFLQDKSQLIIDSNPISSAMVALEAIFKTIKEQKIFILAVDTPLVSLQTIQTLLDASLNEEEKIVLAKDSKGKLHNLCGVFDRDILPYIQECLAKDIHKINYLVNQLGYKEIIFSQEDEFLNLNTQVEYQKALSSTCKIKSST